MQQHTYICRTTTYLHRNCPKIGFHLRPTIFSQNNFSSNICRETIHFETRLWSIDASKGTASCHYINNDELSCVHSMRCRWKQNGAHHPRDQKFLGHVISQLQVYIGTSGVGVGILDRHLWSSSDGTGSLMKYQEGVESIETHWDFVKNHLKRIKKIKFIKTKWQKWSLNVCSEHNNVWKWF